MKWQYLKSGDLIDIIAPSFAKKQKEKFFLDKACEVIKKLGFTPRYSENLIDIKKSTFSANSDEFRLNDFKKALYSNDSKAIWAYRGGYGANKILPSLLNDVQPLRPKPVIGFSDITFLLNFLYLKWKIPSIHGPVLSHYAMGLPFENLEYLRDILLGIKQEISYELFPQNDYAKKYSVDKVILIGGNSMLMQNTLATPYQIDTKDKIIFIEEVGERGYAFDRVLTHLIDANFFQDVRAIIFGDIIGKKEKNGKDMCPNAVQDFINKMKIPVYFIKNIGHGHSNFPLPIGTKANIAIKDNNFFLKVESGGKH